MHADSLQNLAAKAVVDAGICADDMRQNAYPEIVAELVDAEAKKLPSCRPVAPQTCAMPLVKDKLTQLLRFGVGQRVECNTDDGWSRGTIVEIFYTEPKLERMYPGKCAAYQVQLDRGNRVFAPRDHDGVVRAAPSHFPGAADGSARLMGAEPYGAISPNETSSYAKATKYIDLMLAGGREDVECMLMGEPAMINQRLGQRGFDGPLLSLTGDEMEVLDAVMGLSMMTMDESPLEQRLQGPSPSEAELVRKAMARRPESLGVLLSFIAYTPELGIFPDDHQAWAMGGREYKGELKDPIGSAAASLTPDQSSPCYDTVMGCTLLLLADLASWSGSHEDDELVPQAMSDMMAHWLASSHHFPPCIARLVQIICRASVLAWDSEEDPQPYIAIKALLHLCQLDPRAGWILRGRQTEATSLMVALEAVGCGSGKDDVPDAEGWLLDILAGAAGERWRWQSAPELELDFMALVTEARKSLAFGDHALNATGSAKLNAMNLDAMLQELASCASEEDRHTCMYWMIDHLFLPTGRVVSLHGLTRSELNGKVGVVSGTSVLKDTGIRFPIRLLSADPSAGSSAVGGKPEAVQMALRPRNLIPLGPEAAMAADPDHEYTDDEEEHSDEDY